MTDRLVSEIMYHIELFGMKPTRIRLATRPLTAARPSDNDGDDDDDDKLYFLLLA